MAERRGRRCWWWAAVAAALVLAAAGWFRREPLGEAAGWVGDRAQQGGDAVEEWATRLRSIAAEVPDREVEERTEVTESASALVVVGAGPGDCAFALLAVSPAGAGTLTLLPQGLVGVVPGYGEFTLAQALAFEGPDLAALTVTNLLGVRIDRVLSLPAGTLAGALPPSLTVDLPVPLFIPEGGGVVAGPQQLPPATVETLLVTQGSGDPFEWLQRQGAAWRGILDALAAEPEAADRLTASMISGASEVADLLLVLATSEDLLLGSLPVEAAGIGGDEALALSEGAETEFIPSRLGHLLLRTGERPRVEVLNGNGRIGATRVVAEAVVRRGFQVVRTDNADRFDYASTLVVAQGPEAVAAAAEAAGIIGAGSVYQEEAAPALVVEVSIIVGLDIPAGEA